MSMIRTDVRENGCAREQRANAAPDDLPHPISPEGPTPMMLSSAADEKTPAATEPDPRVAKMRATLERVIRHREALLAENAELLKRARHWFVNDGNGYCLACGVLEANRQRHADRAA